MLAILFIISWTFDSYSPLLSDKPSRCVVIVEKHLMDTRRWDPHYFHMKTTITKQHFHSNKKLTKIYCIKFNMRLMSCLQLDKKWTTFVLSLYYQTTTRNKNRDLWLLLDFPCQFWSSLLGAGDYLRRELKHLSKRWLVFSQRACRINTSTW